MRQFESAVNEAIRLEYEDRIALAQDVHAAMAGGKFYDAHVKTLKPPKR